MERERDHINYFKTTLAKHLGKSDKSQSTDQAAMSFA